MLDDHGDQIFAMTDVVAERIRKLGGVALRSIADIVMNELRKRLNDADRVRSLGNQDRKGSLHLQLGAMNLNQLAGGQLLLDTQARDITDSRSGGDHALDRFRAG